MRVLLVAAILVGSDPPPPIATLRDLGPAFRACFRSPDHAEGSQVTVRFSLTSRGTILGKPVVTYSRLFGSMSSQRAFVTAVVESIWRCTPLNITSQFGQAIAGRPLSIRVIGGAPALDI